MDLQDLPPHSNVILKPFADGPLKLELLNPGNRCMLTIRIQMVLSLVSTAPRLQLSLKSLMMSLMSSCPIFWVYFQLLDVE